MPSHLRRRNGRRALAAVVCLSYWAVPGQAATSTWIVGSGNWSTPATNWSPSGAPLSGTVLITNSDTTNRTITFDETSAVSLTALTVDNTGTSTLGGGTDTLSMTSTGLSLSSTNEFIGDSNTTTLIGSGAMTQSVGVNTIGSQLYLGFDALDSGTYSLSGPAGTQITAGGEIIGNNGTGNFVQSGGTNTDNGGFALGFASGSNGTYTLIGTGVLTANSGEAIGEGGTGTLIQTGGTHTVASGNLNLGFNPGSTGTYTLSGGTATITSGNIYVGGNSGGGEGKGNLIVTNTGVLTLANTATINVYNTTGTSLTLSGGTINTGALNLSGNPALFNFTGGTLNWNNSAVNAIVDNTSSANLGSALTMSGGQNLNVAGSEIVGNNGTGSLFLSNGSTNSAGYLYVGDQSGSNGTYTLYPGGALTASKMSVGYSGTGTFTQLALGASNSVLTSANFITVGDQPGGSGTFNFLNGTLNGATLNLGNSSASGPLPAATGTFNQNNSANATFATVMLGENAGASGFYNFTGSNTGTLSVSGAEYDGYNGSGTFMHSGGTNSAATIYVGYAKGSIGAYTLSGNATLTVPQMHDGYAGTGTFTQSGGTFTSSSNITVGDQPGGSGTFNLSGGTLNGNFLYLGNSSSSGPLAAATGTFNQTSGAASFSYMYLGENTGASGFYNLSNGAGLATPTLTVTSAENVGYDGSGTFTQTGGTNSALDLDVGISSNGTYTLSGNGSLSVSDTSNGGGEAIGTDGGTGIFNQSGGTNKVSGGLFVGYAFASLGTYNLSGTGLLSDAMSEVIGGYGIGGGTGTFNQSGGMNTSNGGLIIGNLSSGAYNLSGGIATTNTVTLGNGFGNGGVGTLSVSSVGILNVTGTINVANNGSIINLSGGTINTPALNLGGVPSLLNWTGGTLDITTNITWDSAAATTSTADIFTTSLSIGTNQTLMVTGNETLGGVGPFSLTLNSGSSHYVTGSVTLTPYGTITQNTGSTLYDSSFTQAGGTVNGTLQNQSQFIYQSGAFNGRLLNQGTVTLGSNFIAGNGIENDTTMSLTPSQTVTVNGAGLDNLGTFSLTGGSLSGSGTVTNDFGGTLTGYGTINPALTNNGNLILAGVLRLGSTIANHGIIQGNGTIIGNFSNTGGGNIDVPVNDTLAISSPWTNSSLVTLEGSGAVLGGGTITNTGTIQGAGNITAPITNSTGVIRASGGELDLNGTGDTNGSSAQIQSATGNTVVVVQGLATNSGLIALAGGTFDNNNQPMSNTGTISGNGILRTGNLTNASTGLVLLTTANSSVYGPVTNSTGGNIKIVSNTTTFYGAVTNNGTIKVTSGVANFLGNGVSMTVGGTYNSDPSVNYFNGLATTSTGLVTGGSGDQFYLTDGSAFTNAGTFTNGGILSANTVTNSGTFTQTGTLTETGNFTNSGPTTIGGTQTWSSGTTFTNSAGTTTFQSDAGSASTLNLSLNITGGTVTLASPQHWAGLSILGIGSTLNIANNHAVIADTGGPDDATYTSILDYVKTGAITSTSDFPGYGVGVVDGNDDVSGSPVLAGTIDIAYTLYGDANLDGKVDATDFGIFAPNFGATGFTLGWEGGDFNYDGKVDATDFGLFAPNFGQSDSGTAINLPAADYAALDAFAAANGLSLTSVPEPASAGLILLGMSGVMSRRRRS